MAAVSSGGLAELHEAAASPLARPSAAQLLPAAQSAEGIPRLERLLLAAARRAPRELAGAAGDLLRAGGKRVRPLLLLLSARAAVPGLRARGRVPLALFAFCGEAGALAARAPQEVTAALRDFGMRAGTTFQIADDLLDFESDAATLGKAVLADVTEGKPSLPLAIALKRLPPLREEMAALLKPEPEATEDEGRARVRAFAARLSRTGALGAARRIAEKERDAALAALEPVPQSPTRELLAHVARALLSRSH